MIGVSRQAADMGGLAGDLLQIHSASNIYLGTGPVVRSAYLEQVRRIAPPQLHDRDSELAELAAFCTEPNQGAYVWWRAGPWTGKSALMSWFVLHPPPGVRVISFFVTARYKGQDDRVAFADAILEQLAEILGQPMPTYVTDATREAHLLGMIAKAAGMCQQRGEQLVLVIDGLDEDRGGITGSEAYSIAALLPARAPAGLRIIVAGRPDPPIPADVPADHPLRDPSIVRVLGATRWADVVKADMQRELKRLLRGNPAEQDLLGLVTAAGGGLSASDLAELTGLPVYEIKESLQTVAGRTFTSRASLWQRDSAQPVYVLGHEELQTAATRFLGYTGLAGYQDRLHNWADHYRQKAWPAGTPEYLLRGYYRMLHATGDISRIVVCATDQARHDRMLDVTGGDAAALAEITEALDLLLNLDEPDLLTMLRLAVRRASLAERNANIPTNLPAVWAIVGYPTRAEALARAITHPIRQSETLTALVTVLAHAGDLERAEAVAYAINSPDRQVVALTALIRTTAAYGDLERARMVAQHAQVVAHSIVSADRRATALAALSRALADSSEPEPAEEALYEISRSEARAHALTARVRALARAGDLEQAEAAANAVSDPDSRAEALIALARTLASAGDLERAGAVARSITNPDQQAHALTAIVDAAAVAGDLGRAETIARNITSPDRRAEALTAVARAVAAAGDVERAGVLAGQAEAVARAISDPFRRAYSLTALAGAVAAAGDVERAGVLAGQAEAVARAISDPFRRAYSLTALAGAVAAAGDVERAGVLAGQAEAVARAISDPFRRAYSLTALAGAVAAAGDIERAGVLAGQAEAVARSVASPEWQAQALAALAEAMAAAGDLDRAEAVARSVASPEWQAQALAALAEAMAAAGDLDRAEAVAASVGSPEWQAEALGTLAQASAAVGDNGRARMLAQRAEAVATVINDPFRQAQALTAVAAARAASGDLDQVGVLIDRAETAADKVSSPFRQAEALTALAREVGTNRARSLIARAITVGDWTTPLDVLARLEPNILTIIADEYLNISEVTVEDSSTQSFSTSRSDVQSVPATRQNVKTDPDLPSSLSAATAQSRIHAGRFERFLVAQLPARVPQSADVSLMVRVSARSPVALEIASAEMLDLQVGASGARVTVVVQAPRTLIPLGELEQAIWVPPIGDSQPVRFAFNARAVGLQRIQVTAWAGGTFLAEIGLELSVQQGTTYEDAPARTTPINVVRAEGGEVTLQVRFDGERYTFQLLSEQYLFEPVLAEAVTAQPGQAVERMVATLRAMASGGTSGGYTASNARTWMEQAGVGLWNDMVPELIKEQFWQLQSTISAFSIATGRDVIPWELLYPLAPGSDEGFLVEQFPVMRRVYGQQRFRRIMVGDARYVVPTGSPTNAQDEIAAIRRILGQKDAVQAIAELGALIELIESGRAGPLHFACHNTFDIDSAGSAIPMGGGQFVPLLLNKAVTLQALVAHHPLVFINACRSAGAVPEYTQMTGWAQQFMAAGAGAFVGTLWAVRSESASAFAETFYGALADGTSLGQACRLARLQAGRDNSDPTWLAYTVYGDPRAQAITNLF